MQFLCSVLHAGFLWYLDKGHYLVITFIVIQLHGRWSYLFRKTQLLVKFYLLEGSKIESLH